jgi:hypothetical protein
MQHEVIKIDNCSFEGMENLKYLGTIRNQNSTQEEIKSRLISGIAY